MTLRAAIYARVSSAAQRDAQSIESQLAVLRPFVEARGWQIVGEYLDDGRSATTGKLERREAFARLLGDAAAKRFDVLVIFEVDRLTRTDSIEERAAILGPFQRAGIRIVTPSSEIDLRTMFGQLDATLRSLYAAEESRVRSERIKSGKARAINQNRKPAGPTPFGLAYSRASGAWSIDESAAALLRELLQRLADGESCARIADDFAIRGARAPKSGATWTRATAYRLAHATHATGAWCVNRTIGATVTVPRIVTDEVWHAAQRALTKGQQAGSIAVRTRHVYLLQGLATCGACGEPIVIRSPVRYYNAAREHREHPAAYLCRGRRQRTCGAPIVMAADLDARLWQRVAERLDTPLLAGRLDAASAAHSSDAHDWSRDVEAHLGHLARLERVEIDVLARYRRGLISQGAIDAELAALERERSAVRDQLATAQRAIGASESARVRLRAVGDELQRLRGALGKTTPEQRRALLRELVGPGGVQILDGQAHVELLVLRRAKGRAGRSGPIGVVRGPGYREPREVLELIRLVA